MSIRKCIKARRPRAEYRQERTIATTDVDSIVCYKLKYKQACVVLKTPSKKAIDLTKNEYI
jgi:hypothetical protein